MKCGRHNNNNNNAVRQVATKSPGAHTSLYEDVHAMSHLQLFSCCRWRPKEWVRLVCMCKPTVGLPSAQQACKCSRRSKRQVNTDFAVIVVV